MVVEEEEGNITWWWKGVRESCHDITIHSALGRSGWIKGISMIATKVKQIRSRSVVGGVTGLKSYLLSHKIIAQC